MGWRLLKRIQTQKEMPIRKMWTDEYTRKIQTRHLDFAAKQQPTWSVKRNMKTKCLKKPNSNLISNYGLGAKPILSLHDERSFQRGIFGKLKTTIEWEYGIMLKITIKILMSMGEYGTMLNITNEILISLGEYGTMLKTTMEILPLTTTNEILISMGECGTMLHTIIEILLLKTTVEINFNGRIWDDPNNYYWNFTMGWAQPTMTLTVLNRLHSCRQSSLSINEF